MTNPHIKSRLIAIMEEEKSTKLKLIACIIDHRSKLEPTDEVQLFDYLYDLTLTEINQQYDAIIGDLTDRISKQLDWIGNRFGME